MAYGLGDDLFDSMRALSDAHDEVERLRKQVIWLAEVLYEWSSTYDIGEIEEARVVLEKAMSLRVNAIAAKHRKNR